MSRTGKLAAALGLSLVGVLGCAHCDTCDDFPAPCVGANCAGGGAPIYAAAPAMATAPYADEAQLAPAAPTTSQRAPFSPPAGDPASTPPPAPPTVTSTPIAPPPPPPANVPQF